MARSRSAHAGGIQMTEGSLYKNILLFSVPLIVHEALMVEPTETESKATMDEAIAVFRSLARLAHEDPDALHTAPHNTPVRRLDEVQAARNPVLRAALAE